MSKAYIKLIDNDEITASQVFKLHMGSSHCMHEYMYTGATAYSAAI